MLGNNFNFHLKCDTLLVSGSQSGGHMGSEERMGKNWWASLILTKGQHFILKQLISERLQSLLPSKPSFPFRQDPIIWKHIVRMYTGHCKKSGRFCTSWRLLLINTKRNNYKCCQCCIYYQEQQQSNSKKKYTN